MGTPPLAERYHRRTVARNALVVLLLASLSLAACGGGGSSNSSAPAAGTSQLTVPSGPNENITPQERARIVKQICQSAPPSAIRLNYGLVKARGPQQVAAAFAEKGPPNVRQLVDKACLAGFEARKK